MIIDIAGARGAISDDVYMGLPIIIIIYKKSTQKMEFSTRVGTIAHW